MSATPEGVRFFRMVRLMTWFGLLCWTPLLAWLVTR